MERTAFAQIKKRDGSLVAFNPQKIEVAVHKAFVATGTDDRNLAAKLTGRVVDLLKQRTGDTLPTVEGVQDIVEEVLMKEGYPAVAKAYVLYRQQRAEVRRLKSVIGVRDDLKLTVNAVKVLERRYLLKDEEGNVKETPSGLFRRVARTIAGAEKLFDQNADTGKQEEAFFDLMSRLEFVPNTPTLMNAGGCPTGTCPF